MSVLKPVIREVLSQAIHGTIVQDGSDFEGSFGSFSSAFSTDFAIFQDLGQQFSSAFDTSFASFRFKQEFNSAFSNAFAKQE